MSGRLTHLPAILIAAVVGTTASAEPLLTDPDVYLAMLASGSEPTVNEVLRIVLDDVRLEMHIARLPAAQAEDWMEVLFHPAFVTTLVDESDARKESWDALANLLEAAYFEDTQQIEFGQAAG
ncbi:MAG: hypothetical protein AAGL89_00450 [Pseudomonadota bacterium]